MYIKLLHSGTRRRSRQCFRCCSNILNAETIRSDVVDMRDSALWLNRSVYR